MAVGKTIQTRLLKILNCDLGEVMGFSFVYFEVICREIKIYERKTIYGKDYLIAFAL